MNKSILVSVTLVAVVLGLLMAVQFRTAGSLDSGVPYSREQELTVEKNQLERDLDYLRAEVADLAAKLEEAGKGQSEATETFHSELAKTKLYAGLSAVAGPGVEVVLDHLPNETAPGGGQGLNAIKDDDLLKVINDLRGAGAEAIAVNDQRILATSEVRLAGNHIIINLTKISAPYRVVAIGNATALKSSLEISGGLVEYLSGLGIVIKVEARDNIFIPAYNGALKFDYAVPTQRG